MKYITLFLLCFTLLEGASFRSPANFRPAARGSSAELCSSAIAMAIASSQNSASDPSRSAEILAGNLNKALEGHEKPEAIDELLWEELTPYLLPEESKEAKVLDALFKKKGALLENLFTLELAGFKVIRRNSKNGLIAAKHPRLKKKVIKLFTDDTPAPEGHLNFLRRVQGSEVIRQTIALHGWEEQFGAPKKWLYPLPSKEGQQSFFILVVDEVKMPSYQKHLLLWKSSFVTEELLSRLYILIEEAGMADSLFIDNIPITADGRITFIDTEHFHNRGIPWSRLLRYLNPAMQAHWINLTSCPR